MQLDREIRESASKEALAETSGFKKIAPALALASCSALGLASQPALGRGEPGTWDYDLATLYYAESDDRVVAIEPVFSATRNFEEDAALTLKGVFDVLTGASPNGATPSDSVQTFTKPSGRGNYDVTANDSPLDDSFKDTRVSLSADWKAPLNAQWDYRTGAYASKEYDYLSIGITGGLKRYLNQKNTELDFGLGYAFDVIEPVGAAPFGLTEMPHRGAPGFDADFDASREDDSDTKGTLDLIFGVTQVINRQTLMQWNYSLSYADGYLSDPYKVLSVIDDSAGANFGGNLSDANGNFIYLYEARPDSRMKHSLYWQTKYALESGDVLDASYRFMLDDWGINSHTFDLRYRWQLGDYYLEPHARYYLQSEADFYKRFVTASEYNGGAVDFSEASADYRLSDMESMTLGVKWGWQIDDNRAFNIRLEYLLQTHDGESGFGKLTNQELYPDTDAVMLKLGYSF